MQYIIGVPPQNVARVFWQQSSPTCQGITHCCAWAAPRPQPPSAGEARLFCGKTVKTFHFMYRAETPESTVNGGRADHIESIDDRERVAERESTGKTERAVAAREYCETRANLMPP